MNLFENNIINVYGEKGKTWLSHLPQAVQEIAENWNLKDLHPVSNLSYNYVLSGFQNKTSIILKLNPEKERLEREVSTLKLYTGYGAVAVLAETEGAVLLEQAIPGHSLKSYFPDREMEALEITCEIIKKLHQVPLPRNSSFPHVKDWFSELKNKKNISSKYRNKVYSLMQDLLETTVQEVLLHGDLHHENILINNDKWVVIDPHGLMGDPIYDIVAFIRNPIPELLDSPHAIKIIKNRIKIFSEKLNIDDHRILQWCFVQSVLSWHWSVEDNSDPNYFIRLTETYNTLI